MSTNINNIPIPATCPPITYQDIKKSKPVYQGSYCNVYKICKNEKQYAVKVIFKERIKNIQKEEMKRIYNQIKTLYSIKHEYIIELCGHFHNQEVIGLIFPFFGKQIAQFMRQIKQKKKKMHDSSGLLSLKQFIKIFRGIGSAIAQVHARGLVHRDISQDNILIDQNMNLKLIDFGFVGLIKNCFQLLGTNEFLAPQIIKGKQYNHKVDVWSFGILCYQLLYGIFLFKPKGKNLTQGQIQKQYLKNMSQPIQDQPDTKLLIDQKPPQQLLSHIKSMLSFAPEKRPEIGYLLSKKVFGAQDIETVNYNIQEYVRQKTYRRTGKDGVQGSGKDMSVREMELTLVKLQAVLNQEKNKQINLLHNLAIEQTKLAKAIMAFLKQKMAS